MTYNEVGTDTKSGWVGFEGHSKSRFVVWRRIPNHLPCRKVGGLAGPAACVIVRKSLTAW